MQSSEGRPPGLDDDGNASLQKLFYNRRNDAIRQIYVEDCPGELIKSQDFHGLPDAGGWTKHPPARFLDRHREIHGDERLILADENRCVSKHGSVSSLPISK